jgi:hypothetical protein
MLSFFICSAVGLYYFELATFLPFSPYSLSMCIQHTVLHLPLLRHDDGGGDDDSFDSSSDSGL